VPITPVLYHGVALQGESRALALQEFLGMCRSLRASGTRT